MTERGEKTSSARPGRAPTTGTRASRPRRRGGRTDEGTLELEVADFGPIVEAKVDLRPLTVFVGPSNTGKSYLAILIYALHRVFSGDANFAGRRFRSSRGDFPFLLRRRGQEFSKESIDALLDVADSLANDSELRDRGHIALPPPITDTLRSVLDQQAGVLAGELCRCFGVGEAHSLIRRGDTRRSRVLMRRLRCDGSELAEHRVRLAQKSEFRAAVPAEMVLPVDPGSAEAMARMFGHLTRYLDTGRQDETRRSYAVWDLLESVGSLVLPSLVGPLHLPAFYLPVDRAGVMRAHNLVVSSLIRSAPLAGLRPAARTAMLSGVLADFLEQLLAIDRDGPLDLMLDRTARLDFGKSIEDRILEGGVRVERSPPVDYPRFLYRPHGWKDDLAMANASSMVSELAPVVLYLRYIVGPGNVLILEEPESHLHPAKQVALVEQLAALVEAGVRVIVTTHSEWLLEELANIVRRSEVPVSERGDKAALGPDQVGVWLFEPRKRPKGSMVREIPLDDSGLYPSGYDEVASTLHNEWADIAGHIEADS